MGDYLPIAVALAIVGTIVVAMYVGGALLGPKRRSAVKSQPFECGMDQFETPGDRFGVKFYLIAILFVIFDIDLAFLFPWAVVFRDVGMVAFVSMTAFLAFIAVALWYVWKKGAFRWE